MAGDAIGTPADFAVSFSISNADAAIQSFKAFAEVLKNLDKDFANKARGRAASFARVAEHLATATVGIQDLSEIIDTYNRKLADGQMVERFRSFTKIVQDFAKWSDKLAKSTEKINQNWPYGGAGGLTPPGGANPPKGAPAAQGTNALAKALADAQSVAFGGAMTPQEVSVSIDANVIAKALVEALRIAGLAAAGAGPGVPSADSGSGGGGGTPPPSPPPQTPPSTPPPPPPPPPSPPTPPAPPSGEGGKAEERIQEAEAEIEDAVASIATTTREQSEEAKRTLAIMDTIRKLLILSVQRLKAAQEQAMKSQTQGGLGFFADDFGDDLLPKLRQYEGAEKYKESVNARAKFIKILEEADAATVDSLRGMETDSTTLSTYIDEIGGVIEAGLMRMAPKDLMVVEDLLQTLRQQDLDILESRRELIKGMTAEDRDIAELLIEAYTLTFPTGMDPQDIQDEAERWLLEKWTDFMGSGSPTASLVSRIMSFIEKAGETAGYFPDDPEGLARDLKQQIGAHTEDLTEALMEDFMGNILGPEEASKVMDNFRKEFHKRMNEKLKKRGMAKPTPQMRVSVLNEILDPKNLDEQFRDLFNFKVLLAGFLDPTTMRKVKEAELKAMVKSYVEARIENMDVTDPSISFRAPFTGMFEAMVEGDKKFGMGSHTTLFNLVKKTGFSLSDIMNIQKKRLKELLKLLQQANDNRDRILELIIGGQNEALITVLQDISQQSVEPTNIERVQNRIKGIVDKSKREGLLGGIKEYLKLVNTTSKLFESGQQEVRNIILPPRRVIRDIEKKDFQKLTRWEKQVLEDWAEAVDRMKKFSQRTGAKPSIAKVPTHVPGIFEMNKVELENAMEFARFINIYGSLSRQPENVPIPPSERPPVQFIESDKTPRAMDVGLSEEQQLARARIAATDTTKAIKTLIEIGELASLELGSIGTLLDDAKTPGQQITRLQALTPILKSFGSLIQSYKSILAHIPDVMRGEQGGLDLSRISVTADMKAQIESSIESINELMIVSSTIRTIVEKSMRKLAAVKEPKVKRKAVKAIARKDFIDKFAAVGREFLSGDVEDTSSLVDILKQANAILGGKEGSAFGISDQTLSNIESVQHERENFGRVVEEQKEKVADLLASIKDIESGKEVKWYLELLNRWRSAVGHLGGENAVNKEFKETQLGLIANQKEVVKDSLAERDRLIVELEIARSELRSLLDSSPADSDKAAISEVNKAMKALIDKLGGTSLSQWEEFAKLNAEAALKLRGAQKALEKNETKQKTFEDAKVALTVLNKSVSEFNKMVEFLTDAQKEFLKLNLDIPINFGQGGPASFQKLGTLVPKNIVSAPYSTMVDDAGHSKVGASSPRFIGLFEKVMSKYDGIISEMKNMADKMIPSALRNQVDVSIRNLPTSAMYDLLGPDRNAGGLTGAALGDEKIRSAAIEVPSIAHELLHVFDTLAGIQDDARIFGEAFSDNIQELRSETFTSLRSVLMEYVRSGQQAVVGTEKLGPEVPPIFQSPEEWNKWIQSSVGKIFISLADSIREGIRSLNPDDDVSKFKLQIDLWKALLNTAVLKSLQGIAPVDETGKTILSKEKIIDAIRSVVQLARQELSPQDFGRLQEQVGGSRQFMRMAIPASGRPANLGQHESKTEKDRANAEAQRLSADEKKKLLAQFFLNNLIDQVKTAGSLEDLNAKDERQLVRLLELATEMKNQYQEMFIIRTAPVRKGMESELALVGRKPRAGKNSLEVVGGGARQVPTGRSGPLFEKGAQAVIKSTDVYSDRLVALNLKLAENTAQAGAANAEEKRTITVLGLLARAYSGAKDQNLHYGRSIEDAIVRVFKYNIALKILMKIQFAVANAFRVMTDAQTKFVEIQKVIRPGANLEKMREQAFDLGKAFGVSALEVSEMFKIFAQQGLNATQILEGTKAALLGVNAANLDLKQSVETLTAAYKIWDFEFDKLSVVMDKLMIVQARHAVTTNDLAEVIKRSGAIVSTYGDSMDFLLGIETAITAVTRKTGQEVGTALKTILTKVSDPAVTRALEQAGVTVFKSTSQFRNLQSIFSDLAGKWKNLTNAQKINLAITTVGVRRMDTFTALMNNYDEATEAMIDSQTAFGDASKANAQIMETLTKQLGVAQASLEEFADNSLKALVLPVMDDLVSIFVTLIDLINKIPPKMLGLLTGGVAAVGLLAFLNRTSRAFRKAAGTKENNTFVELVQAIASRGKQKYFTLEGAQEGQFDIFKKIGGRQRFSAEKELSPFTMLANITGIHFKNMSKYVGQVKTGVIALAGAMRHPIAAVGKLKDGFIAVGRSLKPVILGITSIGILLAKWAIFMAAVELTMKGISYLLSDVNQKSSGVIKAMDALKLDSEVLRRAAILKIAFNDLGQAAARIASNVVRFRAAFDDLPGLTTELNKILKPAVRGANIFEPPNREDVASYSAILEENAKVADKVVEHMKLMFEAMDNVTIETKSLEGIINLLNLQIGVNKKIVDANAGAYLAMGDAMSEALTKTSEFIRGEGHSFWDFFTLDPVLLSLDKFIEYTGRTGKAAAKLKKDIKEKFSLSVDYGQRGTLDPDARRAKLYSQYADIAEYVAQLDVERLEKEIKLTEVASSNLSIAEKVKELQDEYKDKAEAVIRLKEGEIKVRNVLFAAEMRANAALLQEIKMMTSLSLVLQKQAGIFIGAFAEFSKVIESTIAKQQLMGEEMVKQFAIIDSQARVERIFGNVFDENTEKIKAMKKVLEGSMEASNAIIYDSLINLKKYGIQIDEIGARKATFAASAVEDLATPMATLEAMLSGSDIVSFFDRLADIPELGLGGDVGDIFDFNDAEKAKKIADFVRAAAGDSRSVQEAWGITHDEFQKFQGPVQQWLKAVEDGRAQFEAISEIESELIRKQSEAQEVVRAMLENGIISAREADNFVKAFAEGAKTGNIEDAIVKSFISALGALGSKYGEIFEGAILESVAGLDREFQKALALKEVSQRFEGVSSYISEWAQGLDRVIEKNLEIARLTQERTLLAEEDTLFINQKIKQTQAEAEAIRRQNDLLYEQAKIHADIAENIEHRFSRQSELLQIGTQFNQNNKGVELRQKLLEIDKKIAVVESSLGAYQNLVSSRSNITDTLAQMEKLRDELSSLQSDKKLLAADAEEAARVYSKAFLKNLAAQFKAEKTTTIGSNLFSTSPSFLKEWASGLSKIRDLDNQIVIKSKELNIATNSRDATVRQTAGVLVEELETLRSTRDLSREQLTAMLKINRAEFYRQELATEILDLQKLTLSARNAIGENGAILAADNAQLSISREILLQQLAINEAREGSEDKRRLEEGLAIMMRQRDLLVSRAKFEFRINELIKLRNSGRDLALSGLQSNLDLGIALGMDNRQAVQGQIQIDAQKQGYELLLAIQHDILKNDTDSLAIHEQEYSIMVKKITAERELAEELKYMLNLQTTFSDAIRGGSDAIFSTMRSNAEARLSIEQEIMDKQQEIENSHGQDTRRLQFELEQLRDKLKDLPNPLYQGLIKFAEDIGNAWREAITKQFSDNISQAMLGILPDDMKMEMAFLNGGSRAAAIIEASIISGTNTAINASAYAVSETVKAENRNTEMLYNVNDTLLTLISVLGGPVGAAASEMSFGAAGNIYGPPQDPYREYSRFNAGSLEGLSYIDQLVKTMQALNVGAAEAAVALEKLGIAVPGGKNAKGFKQLSKLQETMSLAILQIGGMVGQMAGGGGQFAGVGSNLGGMFGKAGFGAITQLGWLGGPIGGLVGSLFGGLFGGHFDKKPEQKDTFRDTTTSNTNAVKKNTEAIINNNELLAASNKMLNVPASFIAPPARGGTNSQVYQTNNHFNIDIRQTPGQSSEELANAVGREIMRQMRGTGRGTGGI